ncbi:hypothetical protein C0Q70_18257 [Pomacea canaliculata]|uniref:Uncharacterized protein n=1 Tax=Pomacea canaliculata TaxID=400727 RepID=A0A2T7NMQ9_POMCA|nr:uncharacterized protein LOC112575360 [Pomacea canaliculata]PVD22444.1 hypothetical protein C0Q70_18257 [Pomacea canaliculata]
MASRPPGYTVTSRRNSQPVYTMGAPPPSERGRRISEVPAPPVGISAPSAQAGINPQVDEKTSRKSRTGKDIIESVPFDPDYYNPDGSLRTVHKMPDFNTSYAEASKARYIRHTRAIENERELQTHEIFDKS